MILECHVLYFNFTLKSGLRCNNYKMYSTESTFAWSYKFLFKYEALFKKIKTYKTLIYSQHHCNQIKCLKFKELYNVLILKYTNLKKKFCVLPIKS